MKNPDRLTLASRGSALARAQTQRVVDRLTRVHPGVSVEVRVVRTTGDRDHRAFGEIVGKGLFTSEVEREVVEGRADAAIHSAKDLTAELASGCAIVCVPERVGPHDVVLGGVGDDGRTRLESLPPRGRIGTSSIRRRTLLAEIRPDLQPVELRGNIDTRLRKLAAGECDAAILALAGLERLGIDGDHALLSPDWWVPAPGQGALAVEALEARRDVVEVFAALDDPSASAGVACERAFAATLEGGCTVPLGCVALVEGERMVVTGYLGGPGVSIRDRISGPVGDAEALGRDLAEAILSSGGRDILDELRSEEAPAPSEP